MKTNPFVRLSFILVVVFASAAQALDGGVESLRQTGKAFASVARAVSPSVVFIQAEGKVSPTSISGFSSPFGEEWPFGDDMFKRFFGDQFPGIPKMPKPQAPRGERRAIGQGGSGFVFATKDGLLTDKTYILTNNHVVEDAENIRVKFRDGREFDAEITGRDPQSDVAVIEIKTGGMPPLPMADSSKIEVGE